MLFVLIVELFAFLCQMSIICFAGVQIVLGYFLASTKQTKYYIGYGEIYTPT